MIFYSRRTGLAILRDKLDTLSDYRSEDSGESIHRYLTEIRKKYGSILFFHLVSWFDRLALFILKFSYSNCNCNNCFKYAFEMKLEQTLDIRPCVLPDQYVLFQLTNSRYLSPEMKSDFRDKKQCGPLIYMLSPQRYL